MRHPVFVAATPILCASCILPALAAAQPASPPSVPTAADAPPPREEATEPSYTQLLDDLVLVPLERPLTPPPRDAVRLTVTGLAALRMQFLGDLTMPSTLTQRDASGARRSTLGQNVFVAPWVRITPRLSFRDWLTVTAQLDFAQGKVLGDFSQGVGADSQPRDASGDAGTYVLPRWLYVDVVTKIGLLRVGMQPNHWGMGILANDGNHAQLFGDPRLGQISERILFATKPLGKDGPLTTAVAGDLVYRDNFARLSRGQTAFQGVLATYLEKGLHQLGFFGVYRAQSQSRESTGIGYSEDLRVLALDVAGHTAAALPGRRDAFVFAEAEGAMFVGSSSALRSAARLGERTQVRSFGGAARVGFAFGAPRSGAVGDKSMRPSFRYGKFVAQAELGYASGDADPNDGVEKRFAFDPNHRVGLLLFDEVLRWSSARSVAVARDPLLFNANRPPPGVDYLPTNGGVVGAQYINPTFVYRSEPGMDLRAGMVVAQATADVVNPVYTTLNGRHQNDFGGDPKRRDLGLELDVGVEKRFELQGTLRASVGAQVGVLFPGGALADMSGRTLATPWVGILRSGLDF